VNANTNSEAQRWPLGVKVKLFGNAGIEGVVTIRPGITTLVGPNGSGKTRALRAIKSALDNTNYINVYGRKTHFLAAGRSSPLENFRAAVFNPGFIEQSDAAVGNSVYQDNWWNYESVTGSLLALNNRADLRLKIEARLQQLFDRSVQFSWSQNGLNIRLLPMSGGATYAANHEASGILQLVALLAAIHNDEIGALLIDEPEISLHPQHQAFLLEEMERVAGDPSDPKRKLIVIATHSASLLPLRTLNELPFISFFNSVRQPPTQVESDAEILKRAKLAALIARLSTTHRMAMFAERVLLVEGPSDEIIATQLARCLDLRLLARNAQILPITGKGEFVEATKLFRLMNKHVAVLADLDALADDNVLVRSFSDLPQATAIADRLGRTSLTDLDNDLRIALEKFMSKHQSAVDTAAVTYPDWSSKDSNVFAKRRVTLARLLTNPRSFGDATADAESLFTRYNTLLDALAELGCFFLRQGAVENYYRIDISGRAKPELAADEAAQFEASGFGDLKQDYKDIITALSYIAPNHYVDEDQLLRPKLSAVLAAAFQSMKHESSNEQLNALARATIGTDAEVFELFNGSTKDDLRIKVQIASPLFQRDAFPFEISNGENLNIVVPNKLPGIRKE